MTGELEDLKRIVTSLRSGTDDQAAALLARLRLGGLPENVAQTLPAIAAFRAVPGQPPRYASLDHHILWLWRVNNLVSASWTPLEAERVTSWHLIRVKAQRLARALPFFGLHL
jgi:hypothetical protein